LAVASMFTTAELIRATTSANVGTRAAGGGAVVRETVWRSGVVVGPARTLDLATPPAAIAPTRNATTAVRAMVTTVTRRDIYFFIISFRNASSSSVSTP